MLLLGGAFILVLLFAVGALAYVPLNSPASVESAPSAAAIEPTAKEAFASASKSAKRWRDDARLAGARAHCRGDIIMNGGQVEWAFQFFSPATQQLALFAVSDGQVRRIRQGLSPYEVPTLSIEEWQVDSREAVGRWWREGGGYLAARRPDTEVTMRLYPSRGGDLSPIWAVGGSVPDQETSLVVQVDASDGSILDEQKGQ